MSFTHAFIVLSTKTVLPEALSPVIPIRNVFFFSCTTLRAIFNIKFSEIFKNNVDPQEYIEKNNIKSGYIFVNKKNKLPFLKGAFEKVIEKCGISNFRFHDLRHTYASYLAQDGAELLEIALLLGHKTTEQVKIYAHLTKKRTAKVVRKMSANRFDFA